MPCNIDPSSLIMSLEEAARWRRQLRSAGKKLALTNGCFDIIHRGHCQYLIDAAEQADALLLLLNSDSSVRALKGPGRPLVSQNDRAFVLAALKPVDAVVIFDTPRCTDELLELEPDVYVKGGDYTVDSLNREERGVLEKVGADIRFIPFVKGFSSSGIIERIKG